MVGRRAAYTVRAGGSRLRARGRKARGKMCGLLGRACQRAAQVVLRIGVTAGETGAGESQDSLDLLGGDPAAQQARGAIHRSAMLPSGGEKRCGICKRCSQRE